MRILRFKNVNEVASAVEEELRTLVLNHNPLRVFLPTGKTPLPLYKRLCADSDFWKNKLDPIQIDDFIQIERPFLKVLEKEIIKPLNLKMSSWEPGFSNEQTNAHVEKILSKPIDLAILGLGPNGHVGFHEPGQSATFIGGKVTVTDETRKRVDGAKTRDVFTFGVGAFLKAREIFLIVTGKEKEKIFKEFQNSKPTESLPASLLKDHSDLKVFTDL